MNLLRPPRHIVGRGGPSRDQFLPARVIPIPNRRLPLPQEILVVQPQFLQTRPCHIGQFHLRFLRRAARQASLGDILHPAACRLRHLVVRAAPPVHIAVTEPHRHIIDHLCNLETLQFPVSAVLWDQRFILRHGMVLLCPLPTSSTSSAWATPST